MILLDGGRRKALALSVAALAFAAPALAGEILVFGAASLTESLQELGKAFERRTGTAVRFSFGSSSDLARQIRSGAPADVFFSADTAKMDLLEKSGLVRREDRREFLGNRLVVVAPLHAAHPPTGPAGLVALRRLAVADPQAVPAGIYAKKWLESVRLWKDVEPRIVPMLDVRAALAAVETEAAEAAIVYKTDAAMSKRVEVAFEVQNGPEITYSLARAAASRSPFAQAFVDFLSSAAARSVFEKRGFVVRGDP